VTPCLPRVSRRPRDSFLPHRVAPVTRDSRRERLRRRRPLPLLPLSAHAVARAAPPRRRLSPPRARARAHRARRRLRTSEAPPDAVHPHRRRRRLGSAYPHRRGGEPPIRD